MQPSSLVFIAILAMWAAYLLPHWAGRRHAIGEARSADRHSEGLRVLDRRHRTPGGRSTTHLLTTAAEPGDVAPQRSAVAGAAEVDDRTVAQPVPQGAERAVESGDESVAAVTRPPARRAPEPVAPATSAAVVRRRLQVFCGLAGLTTATGIGTIALPWFPVWTFWIVSTLFVLDLAALVVVGRRRSVVGSAAGARVAEARPAARADAARSTAGRPAAPRPGARPAEGRPAPARPAGRPAAPLAGRPATPAAPVRRSAAEEGVAVPELTPATPAAASTGGVRGGLLDEETGEVVTDRQRPVREDDTWVPVPVPPPVYTMKPVVQRPEPAPLPAAPPATPAPAPAAAAEPQAATMAATGTDGPVRGTTRPWEADHSPADDFDLDAVLARRRAANG